MRLNRVTQVKKILTPQNFKCRKKFKKNFKKFKKVKKSLFVKKS